LADIQGGGWEQAKSNPCTARPSRGTQANSENADHGNTGASLRATESGITRKEESALMAKERTVELQTLPPALDPAHACLLCFPMFFVLRFTPLRCVA